MAQIKSIVISCILLIAPVGATAESIPAPPAQLSINPAAWTGVSLALTVIAFLFVALTAATILALFLHCAYDLLRFRALRHGAVLLAQLDPNPAARDGCVPPPSVPSFATVVDQARAQVRCWPQATLNLPPSLLAGQLAATFDAAIANVTPQASDRDPEGKDLLIRLKAESDRVIDELQVSLNRSWKLTDFGISFVLLLFQIMAAWREALRPWIPAGDLMSALPPAIMIALFVSMLVPQIRPWVERLLQR